MTFKEDILFHDKIKKSFVTLVMQRGGESHAHINRQHISTCQCTYYRVVYVVAKQP